jgi:hypothetical protein
MAYGMTLLRQAQNPYRLRESGAIIVEIEVHQQGTRMTPATLKNQLKIIANQRKMLRDQSGLRLVIGNQLRILRNQEAIIKNQRKILANHARILAKELPLTGRR